MLDVRGSDELQAVILALRQMDRTLRKQIYRYSRQAIAPDWKEAIASASTTDIERQVLLRGARADVSADRITLVAASSKRKLRGGASPADIGHAVEFGAPWRRAEITATSSKGKRYSYTRTVNKQFKPRRARGHVAYPVAMRNVGRYASLWVQITVRAMHEAVEGRSS
ncbi:hypothetical protein [Curtobacterium aurantiacum]|uniref:hypothetical protein n=1 Tax=Curtobacterium aurantiacum TaxID=3236919 RepID=UPI001BDFEC66|nr:hypothetical protein [Curtobacterium flaccumfaciens]MBT1676005.1 hypothetical protein [Curtobacterium flaccumfaciens pv. flaccumfaciens]